MCGGALRIELYARMRRDACSNAREVRDYHKFRSLDYLFYLFENYGGTAEAIKVYLLQ